MKTLSFLAGALATGILLAGPSTAQSVSIDPATQQAYIKASNTDSGDLFGRNVAVCGDTLVVGAEQEDSAATNVDGDGSDNGASNAGAAYVFVRSGDAWTQQAYLKPSNTDEGDSFGQAVAISGDTIVVGAPNEASAATTVDGDASDNSAQEAGAAYVFVRSGDAWTQQAYLKADNAEAFDGFGWAVAIHGDTIVVGAEDESSGASGVNGDGSDNSADGSGAAYVFVRDGTNWTQQAYLKASHPDADDDFGGVVAVWGDTLVVASTEEASAAVGVDGDASDNSAPEAGAAYVFVRNGTTWTQQAYLKASNSEADDEFGASLAIWEDTIVVGADDEDGGAAIVNGDETDNSIPNAGAAYVFERSGEIWSQQAYLKAANPGSFDGFGFAVALARDLIAIGAPYEASSATGVNGETNDAAEDAGAVYVFARAGDTWSQRAYLKASNTDATDAFGIGIGLWGDTLAVGAGFEDGAATGVDGDGLSNGALSAGAAYAFDIDVAFIEIGFSLPGIAGSPELIGNGDLSGGSLNSIDLLQAAPSALAALFLAVEPVTPAPFKQGTLVPVPILASSFAMTSAQGEIPLTFTWTTGLPSDVGIYLQWAIADAAAPAGVSLSNALRGTTE